MPAQPEFVSNLEWLLQSPQATPEALAQAAWEECGAALRALGEALFGAQAETFAALSLAEVLLRSGRYRGAESPCAWVLHLGVEAALKKVEPSRRPEAARRAAALLEGEVPPEAAPLEIRLTPKEAACLQDAAPLPSLHAKSLAAPVSACLGRAVALAALYRRRRRRAAHLKEALLALFVAAVVWAGIRFGQAMDAHRLAARPTQVVVVEVIPTPLVSPSPIPSPQSPYPPYAILYRAQEGDTPASLASRFNVGLNDLMAWNGFSQSGAPLEAGRLVVVGLAQPKAVSGADVGLSPDGSVFEAVSPGRILAGMRRSADFWSTLWVDAFVADYGPEGYTGPPQVRRQQAWVVQGSRSLVLDGPAEGAAERLWYADGEHLYRAALPDARLVPETEKRAGLPPVDERLLPLIFPASLVEESPALRYLGRETMLSRAVLHVEALFPGGSREVWWVDWRYGFLLRRLVYSRRGALLADVRLRAVSVNRAFEAAIFQPPYLPVDFSGSPQGTPEAKRPAYPALQAPPGHFAPEKTPPPPDFDPAAARLAFRWDTWLPAGEAGALPPARVELFADDYFLDSWESYPAAVETCVRSPDGGYLAWLETGTAANGSPLSQVWTYPLLGSAHPYPREFYWLHDPEADAAPDLAARPALALSAAGEYLYLAADSAVKGTGIYRLTTRTGEIRRLFNAFHVGGLSLSPSGEYLAWLEYRDMGVMELVEASLREGRIVSRRLVRTPFSRDSYPLALPLVWEKPFPWPQPGWLGCSEPPP